MEQEDTRKGLFKDEQPSSLSSSIFHQQSYNSPRLLQRHLLLCDELLFTSVCLRAVLPPAVVWITQRDILKSHLLLFLEQ